MILRITIGDNTNSYNLDNYNKDVISFGRSSECDIVINAPSVSKLHGCIYKEGNSWNIKDLDSRYGVYLNGSRIKEDKIDTSARYSVGALGSDDAILEFFSGGSLKKTDILTGNSSLANIAGNDGKKNVYEKKKDSPATQVTRVVDISGEKDSDMAARVAIGIVSAVIVLIIIIILM